VQGAVLALIVRQYNTNRIEPWPESGPGLSHFQRKVFATD
jgi:hypothetical protein